MAQRSIFDYFQQNELDRALQSQASRAQAETMPVGLGLVPTPQNQRDLWQYGEQRELQAEVDRPRLTQFLEKDPSWRYGSISPQATREVDGKTERSWAIPDIVRDPIRGFMGLLDQTGEALQGRQVDTAQVGTDLFDVGVGVHLQTGLAKLAAGKLPFELTPEELAAINSWHGTAADYAPVKDNPLGKFDWHRIGTGEGAQAFSYGHYTTGHAGIGRTYLKQDRDRKYRAMGIDPNQNTTANDYLKPDMLKKRLGSRIDARDYITQDLSDDDVRILAESGSILSPYYTHGFLLKRDEYPITVLETMQRGLSQHHAKLDKYTPEELTKALQEPGLRGEMARKHKAGLDAESQALDVLFDEKNPVYGPGPAVVRRAVKMFGKDSPLANYIGTNISEHRNSREALNAVKSARDYIAETVRKDTQNMARFPNDADYYKPLIARNEAQLKQLDLLVDDLEKNGIDYIHPSMDELAESVDVSPGAPGQTLDRDTIIEDLQRKRNRALSDNANLQDQIQRMEGRGEAGNIPAIEALKDILKKGEGVVSDLDNKLTEVRKAKVQFSGPDRHFDDWASRANNQIPFADEDPLSPTYGQVNPEYNLIYSTLSNIPTSQIPDVMRRQLKTGTLSPKVTKLFEQFLDEHKSQVGLLSTLSSLAKDPAKNLYGVPPDLDFSAKDAKDKFIEYVRKSVPRMVTSAAEPEDLADATNQAERFIRQIKNTDFAPEPVEDKIGGLLDVELTHDLEDYFLYDRPIGASEVGISDTTGMGLLSALEESGAFDKMGEEIWKEAKKNNPDYDDFSTYAEMKADPSAYDDFRMESVADLMNMTGKDIYYAIGAALDVKAGRSPYSHHRQGWVPDKQGQKEASELLAKHGVPGTRFFHWETRKTQPKNPTEADYNYVTYGDDLLNIRRKAKSDAEVNAWVDAFYKKKKNKP